MSVDQPRPYWIDCLRNKHECWPYGDGRDVGEVPIRHGGRSIRLVMPNWLTNFEVLTTCQSGECLFLIARTTEPHYEEGTSILMVARHHTEEDVWSVVVWHVLYPWALEYLGLIEKAKPSG